LKLKCKISIFLYIPLSENQDTMDFTYQVESSIETANIASSNEQIVVEANKVPNSVLQRLMEEVKNDKANDMFSYDRAHNRHNRS
jgi:hypothetical protein